MKKLFFKYTGYRIILFVILLGLLIGLAVEIDRIWWAKQDWDELLSASGIVAGTGFLLVVGIFTVGTTLSLWVPSLGENILKQMVIPRGVVWLISPLLIIFPAWFLLYSPWGFVFTGFFPRVILFISITSLVSILLYHGGMHSKWESVSLGMVLIGSMFILALELQSVTAYPFSLTWSEGNRIYDYSVLFGRRLYDYPADQSLTAYLDRGRQALWGLPFLLPKVTIWSARLWDAIVKTVPYVLLGWMVFREKSTSIAKWMVLG